MGLFRIGYDNWFLVAFYVLLLGVFLFGIAGFFLFLLGSIINWPTLVTLLMLPVLWLAYYRLAKQEEADALARFGDEYRRYQATSGMFWPRIRR